MKHPKIVPPSPLFAASFSKNLIPLIQKIPKPQKIKELPTHGKANRLHQQTSHIGPTRDHEEASKA